MDFAPVEARKRYKGDVHVAPDSLVMADEDKVDVGQLFHRAGVGKISPWPSVA